MLRSHHKCLRSVLVTLSLLGVSPLALAAEGSGLEFYGFAQLDYIQDFNRVHPSWNDTLRPSRIPTTDGQYGSDGQASLSAKQSRFGVQSSLPVDGETLFTKIEIDFFGVGVDEGQTTPRFRHAYGQWGAWLGGQTNSVFMDGDVFPNIVDYWGPSGMVFLRTPQIRWTPIRGSSSLAFAIEKPADDIDTGLLRVIDPAVGTDIKADEKFPDITAAWRSSGDWGHYQLSGIIRQIGWEDVSTPDNEPSEQKTGWGVNLSTNIKFGGKNKLILAVVTGEGIASFMNDGGTDMAPEGTSLADLSSELIPLTGLTAYYDHWWNDRWSSSIGFSQTEVENSNLQTADAFNRGQYASVNILNNSSKNMLMGAEFLWGNRKSNDGTENDDSRVQITMKYSFSSKDY